MTRFFHRSEASLSKYFSLFLLGHLFIWLLLPTLIYQNPPTDSLEGIAWGQLWLWGYEKHPFLAPWLSAGATHVLGAVGWPIYLLSQLSVITCFLGVYQLGKKFFSAYYGFAAVLMLEGINYYNLSSAIFDPNILMLPLWIWLSITFYEAITTQKLKFWFYTGLLAGLSMLAKYESGLLILLLLMFQIIDPKARKSFLSPGFYLSFIIGFLVFLPNLIWLYDHHFNAIFYAVNEIQTQPTPSHSIFHRLKEPFQFLLEQLGNVAPILILAIPFYAAKRRLISLEQSKRNFLLILTFGPTLFTLLLAFFSQGKLVSRWAFPFYNTLTLYFLYALKPEISLSHIKKLLIWVLGLTLIYAIGMLFYFRIMPLYTNHAAHSDSFPGQAIANQLTEEWHQHYQQKLIYIAGDHHVVVNISAFSTDHPIPFFNWNLQESPWVNLKKFENKGAIFVLWQREGEDLSSQIKQLKAQYPRLEHEHWQAYSRLIANPKIKPVLIWSADLPPAQE